MLKTIVCFLQDVWIRTVRTGIEIILPGHMAGRNQINWCKTALQDCQINTLRVNQVCGEFPRICGVDKLQTVNPYGFQWMDTIKVITKPNKSNTPEWVRQP